MLKELVLSLTLAIIPLNNSSESEIPARTDRAIYCADIPDLIFAAELSRLHELKEIEVGVNYEEFHMKNAKVAGLEAFATALSIWYHENCFLS